MQTRASTRSAREVNVVSEIEASAGSDHSDGIVSAGIANSDFNEWAFLNAHRAALSIADVNYRDSDCAGNILVGLMLKVCPEKLPAEMRFFLVLVFEKIRD